MKRDLEDRIGEAVVTCLALVAAAVVLLVSCISAGIAELKNRRKK